MPEFLLPIPKPVLLKMLQSESRQRGFSDPAVRVSLLLDVDAGRIHSQRDYVNLWGWTYKRVRYHWEEIWQDVTNWCCNYGAQMYGPLWVKLPEEWRAWARQKYDARGAHEGRTKGAVGAQVGAQNDAITAQNEGLGAHEGRTLGAQRAHHSIHPSSPSFLESVSGAPPVLVSQNGERPRADSGPPFEPFWEAFGKKQDRKKCEAKWARMSAQDRAAAMEHVPRYVAATPNPQYRKNPLTYLNGECWNDEIEYRTEGGSPERPAAHRGAPAPGGRGRGVPAEQHTFDGAGRTAERAIQRYHEIFGDGEPGGAGGSEPGEGAGGGSGGSDPGYLGTGTGPWR